MKMMNNRIILAAVLMTGLLTVSCTDKIVIDNIDKEAYGNVETLTGFLRDANSGRINNVMELYKEPIESELVFGLNRAPEKGVDVVVSYDASYLDIYNAAHETDFSLYPEAAVKIENGGKITLAPDEKLSYSVGLSIEPAQGLADDQVYLVPVKAVSTTEGVVVAESHCVYLVKNKQYLPYNVENPDETKIFLYYEVNNQNPLNSTLFIRESGKPYFDYVCLFASNINYNSETGEVYIMNNENVQFLLDNREQYLVPLQKMGIKVILGLLGNHDEAGLAQLSDVGARDYAEKLKAICDAYDLDGVNFDDEYSSNPDLSNPLLTQKTYEAASRVVYETKRIMPDKHVSVFSYAYMNTRYFVDVDGVDPSEYVDCSLANYGSRGVPAEGSDMTYAHCSGVSWEMNYDPAGTTYASTSRINTLLSYGYGWLMQFAMYDNSNKRAQVDAINRVSNQLFGEGIKDFGYMWYEKESLELKPLP